MVSINSSYTLGQLNFNNGGNSGAPTAYLLTGNGNLTLNNSGSGASVNVSSGSLAPELGANVTLTLADSSLTTTFNIASGSSLVVGGAIGQSSSGQSIVLAGGGTLELASPNTYTGSTTINSGTLQIDSGASIAHTSSVSIAAGGTLQLAGTTGALPSTVNIATHGTGSNGDGALVLTGAATETVGTISGDTHQITDGSQQVTVYSGNTTVGDGNNAASLTATQILQNTLTINAGSTVTIAPSGSGIPTDAVAAASSVATSDSTADSDSSSDSSSDPFTAIQAAIASGSISSAKGQQLENRIAAIERLAATDPGLDVSLLEDRVLAALPSTIGLVVERHITAARLRLRPARRGQQHVRFVFRFVIGRQRGFRSGRGFRRQPGRGSGALDAAAGRFGRHRHLDRTPPTNDLLRIITGRDRPEPIPQPPAPPRPISIRKAIVPIRSCQRCAIRWHVFVDD